MFVSAQFKRTHAPADVRSAAAPAPAALVTRGPGCTARLSEAARKRLREEPEALAGRRARQPGLCARVFPRVWFPRVTGNYYLKTKCKEDRTLTDVLKRNKNETEHRDSRATEQ